MSDVSRKKPDPTAIPGPCESQVTRGPSDDAIETGIAVIVLVALVALVAFVLPLAIVAWRWALR